MAPPRVVDYQPETDELALLQTLEGGAGGDEGEGEEAAPEAGEGQEEGGVEEDAGDVEAARRRQVGAGLGCQLAAAASQGDGGACASKPARLLGPACPCKCPGLAGSHAPGWKCCAPLAPTVAADASYVRTHTDTTSEFHKQ